MGHVGVSAGGRLRAGLVAAVLVPVLVAGCSGDTGSSSARPTRSPGDTASDVLRDPGRSEPVADPVYPARGNPAVDVLHYGLTIGYDPGTRTLTGSADLLVRAARDLDTVRLDLGTAMRVTAVTADGRAVPATHPGEKLVVPLGRRLAREGVVRIVVAYGGRPEPIPGPARRADALRLGARVAADGSLYSVQEPYGALTWYPVNDQPSDEARYDTALTVPAGWAGVSSGAPVSRTDADGRTTFRWRETDPMASYLVAFVVDRLVRTDAVGPRGLPVTYWVRPADTATLATLRGTPAILSWLEGLLGPYPFDTAGVVVVPEKEGMETQTMITLGSELPAEVLAHEFAHQWFGDSVTPRTWRDVWLNEGFAMYVQLRYETERQGADEAAVLARWRRADAGLRKDHGPPGRYYPGHFASSNVYLPPALMLNAIRREIGDARFAGLLREWPQRHRNTTQDRASFTAWVNAYTGRDLTPLIDRWLDSPTTPA